MVIIHGHGTVDVTRAADTSRYMHVHWLHLFCYVQEICTVVQTCAEVPGISVVIFIQGFHTIMVHALARGCILCYDQRMHSLMIAVSTRCT